MNNIEKSNLIPFVNGKLYKNNSKLLFSDIINGNTDTPQLPLIPKIYFCEDSDNANGQSIINKYYILKKRFKELIIIKDLIISIIKTFKYEFENIKVFKNTYNLQKKNLHKSIKDTLQKSFPYQNDFILFVKDFVKNEYSLINKNNDSSPLFKIIFENEYIGSSKTKNFLLKLFNKYIKIRKIIIESVKIDENYGLIAFDPFFNLKDVINFQSNIKKNSSNENINYNKYIYQNNLNESSLLHSELSPPYTNISNKINIFNLLYINSFPSDYYKELHLKNIESSYKIINTSLYDLLSEKNINNLYNIINKTLLLDFYTIDFIYKYVDPKIFNNAIDIHYNIKNKIFKDINIFSSYYNRYIEWYDENIDKNKNKSKNNYDNELDFAEFYKNLIEFIDNTV